MTQVLQLKRSRVGTRLIYDPMRRHELRREIPTIVGMTNRSTMVAPNVTSPNTRLPAGKAGIETKIKVVAGAIGMTRSQVVAEVQVGTILQTRRRERIGSRL